MPDSVLHRVLLVEDQPTLAEWVRAVCAVEPDFELRVCHEGSKALEMAKEYQPTAVLQDLIMPGVSGFSLLAAYRRDPSLAQVPIIVLSSVDEVHEKARAFALGAADYLVKLPDPVELVARVRAHSKAFHTRRELREVQEQLELTLDHAPIGTALVAPDGRCLRVNDALCRILGYAREELLLMHVQQLTHPEDIAADLELSAQLLQGQIRSYDLHKRYLHRTGSIVWAHIHVALVRDEAGAPRFLVAQIQDVTAQRAAEQAAQHQAAITRAVIDSMNDTVLVADVRGEILILNEVAKRLFGPELAAGIPEQWDDGYGLFHADQNTRCTPESYPMSRALRGEKIDEVVLWMNMPGWREGQWHSVTGNPVLDSRGELIGAVTVGRDITTRKKTEEQIRETALRDELTGLFNRRGFHLLAEQHLKLAAREQHPVFVLFVDLDGMKAINDQHGHDAGDEALRATATALRSSCRGSDVIGRLGGDEFVIVAHGSSEVAHAVRERILTATDQIGSKLGLQFPLSLSIGIATSSTPERTSLADLLAAADEAMYEAKRRRRPSQNAKR
ncbi:MAG: hypothetical protein JWN04_1514 [Myxococcaceae bacterium]|nr:hypothetical protein [Myxococcaceae bacterium]